MTIKARNNLLLVIAGLGILVGITLQRSQSQRQIAAGLAGLEAIGQGKPVLLQLSGEGCPACMRMLPTLDKINKEYPGQFTVAYYDVWKDPSVAQKYGISAIPTLIFFDKDGTELFRHEGVMSKTQLLSKWKELGIDLSPI